MNPLEQMHNIVLDTILLDTMVKLIVKKDICVRCEEHECYDANLCKSCFDFSQTLFDALFREEIN